MKLINPSVEIWEQDVTNPDTLVEAMWVHIARCVRVCYQVDKPKCTETEEEYVKRVIFRKPYDRLANHYSVLEHGAVYFSIEFPDVIDGDNIDDELYELANILLKYSKFSKVKKQDTEFTHIWHISTNLRVLVEHDAMWAFKYAVPFNPKWHVRRVTVSFITSLGIAREFNRHRVHSISEESTRYCNYGKDRFGGIAFIKPTWYTEGNGKNDRESFMDSEFELTCEEAEKSYLRMISWGATPQQAREVLPLCTKCQTIHTAFVDDWKEFFALRSDGVSGPPHPDAEILAKPLKEEFINHKYI